VWAVLTVWAVGWGAFAGRESVLFSWGFFVKAGSVLFGGGPEGGLHFYHAHPELQFGPVATLLAAPFVALPHPIGGYAVIGLMSLAGAVAIAQGVALLPAPRRSLADGPDASDLPAGPRTLLLAGLLVIPVWSELSVHIGHLDDVIAVVAILAALHAVLQAQPVPAGLLVAIAIDAKPWVLPAAVVLLAVPGVRRALVACAAGVAVAWAPFVIADPATITSAGTFRIPVVAGSALRVLGVHDRLTPAWCRPTQALLGLLIAGVLVWRGAIGAALLAVLAARLGLDPETYQYYSGGAIIAALAADRTFGHRAPWATASVLLLVWLPAKLSGIPASTEGVLRLAWAGGILLVLLVAVMPRAGAGWTRIPVRAAAQPAAATDAEGALIS